MRNRLLEEGRPNSVVRLAEHLFSAPIVTAAVAGRDMLDHMGPAGGSLVRRLLWILSPAAHTLGV